MQVSDASARRRLRVLSGHVRQIVCPQLAQDACAGSVPRKRRVAVIGTGISGTAAVKSCLEAGLEVVCFEKQADIGGFWRYKQDPEFPSVYNCTHIDSMRDHNAFGTVPAKREQPQCMTHQDVLEYLRRNHRECDLHQHVRLNHEVTWITDAKDDQASGLKRWRVEYTNDSGEASAEVFEGVMICSGRHSRARLPRFEGMDRFKGFQVHTNRYKDAATHGLVGKRICVVGVGNSGNDMINDNARTCEHIWWVARKGTWILQTHGEVSKGLGNERVLHALQLELPWQVLTRPYEASFKNQEILNKVGLRPDHHALSAHPAATGPARGTPEERGADGHPVKRDVPTIHDHCAAGLITGKRGITRITETSVIFSDGDEVEVDAIIYATGFKQAVDFLDPAIVDMSYDREDAEVADKLYQYVWPMLPGCGSIGFIAFCQSVTFLCSELQSRLFAGLIAGTNALPAVAEQEREMRELDQSLREQFTPSPRHAIQGATRMPYYDNLAMMIGCYPSLLKVLTQRPSALWHAFFTPWTNLTYRLVGPGRQPDAEKWIEEQVQSTREAMGRGKFFMTRGSAPRYWPNSDYWKQVFALWVMVMKIKIFGFDPASVGPRPDYLAPEYEYGAEDVVTKEAQDGVAGSRSEQVARTATITAKM